MMTLVRWHRARNMHSMPHEMSRLVNEFFRGGMQDKASPEAGFLDPGGGHA